MEFIRCKKCGKNKKPSSFYISSIGIILKNSHCKSCVSIRNKQLTILRRQKRDAEQEELLHINDKNIWRTVPHIPTCYVRKDGTIISYTERQGYNILAFQQSKGHNGYITCCPRISKKSTSQYVHRLIAMCYVPGRSKKRNCVNHRDGNKSNNVPSNLEWVSHTENNRHMYSVLGYHGSLYGVRGAAHPNSKERRLSKELKRKKGE